MLSAYNYTIYAPTFAAMQTAQQTMGLPTWKEVMAIVNNWESVADQYGFTSQSEAADYVKEYAAAHPEKPVTRRFHSGVVPDGVSAMDGISWH